MKENICTILLNRTLNRDTDDAPTGTIEGNEYYLDVKNGLKKWEQYIDIAPIIDSDEDNHLYIDSYLYLKIRDDYEFLLVYTDLFLLRDSHDKTNVKYYPLHCHHTDEYSTGAWIDTQRFLVLEQLDEANINNNGIDIPVESKWGIQKNDGDKLVVTCTVNGNYLIRYITGNDLYVLTYVIQYSLNRYVTSYTFVPFSWFKNIVENNFDEYGLYIHENVYYGLFWSLRNNSLKPSLNNIISLILKGSSVDPEYTFNIYLSGELTLHWKYSEYLSLFKEGMYNDTEEINGNKPIVLLYPLFFNKAVSLTYVAPDESVIDTKYFIHGNNKSFRNDSYELYKHNYYIPYKYLDVNELKEEYKELPTEEPRRFRIIESYPCDFNRFNIKISPMWDSELGADPVAIELRCVLKNRDTSIADLQVTYIYHKKDGKLICEKIDDDAKFDITGKNKQNLLRSELSFFLNDDEFKISELSSVEVTVTPVMIFGPLYDLSKVITIETDKINTNTIELSIYKYYYDQNKIILTYNIELYLDVNATIYNDANDPEHCPHCYITKLSDFIANGYRTDKEKGVEIEEISKSLLSSVYNTINIPLDKYIVSKEIYVIEFCMYIHHLGSFIKRSLFRIMNTTEMFNRVFLDGRMVYSDGLVIENVNDFQLLYLDPGDKYVYILMSEGSFKLLNDTNYTNGIPYIKTFDNTSFNINQSIRLKAPEFTDEGSKPSLIFRCSNPDGEKTFPYTFDITNNNIETIHRYYLNNQFVQDDTKLQWKIHYSYKEVTKPDKNNDFKNTPISYQDISLMQYGAMNLSTFGGAFGIVWKQEPLFKNVGAFNITTYGYSDESDTYISWMYQNEGTGHTLNGLWGLSTSRSENVWSENYMDVFNLTPCPAANNSFIPVYVLGRQAGTLYDLSGDGRIHGVDYIIDTRIGTVVTGYGSKRQNAGIPTGDSSTLWGGGDYIGLIILKSSNSLLTGIWFARERIDNNIFLRNSEAWVHVRSQNIAKVMAAKLSLYYFRIENQIKMGDIYGLQHGIALRNNIYILNEGEVTEGYDVCDVKLSIFALFRYNQENDFKLLPTKDNGNIKLYRFINLNDHIQYNVNNTNLLLKDIKQLLVIGLSGSEENSDNILNNLFFNNLTNNSIANQLIKFDHNITDQDDDFIYNIIKNKTIITKSDLLTHSLFYEYNKDFNSLRVINLTTKVNEQDTAKYILCVYPDGNFSVTINTRNDVGQEMNKLRYCVYNEHLLLNINQNSSFYGLSEIESIENVSRYAYVKCHDNPISSWVRPRIVSFNKADQSFGFMNTQWKGLWVDGSKLGLIRTKFDLANEDTLDTLLTEVIQNYVHPI